MSHTESTDVLVVGAGPVGLTLAITLARAGASVRVIEQETNVRNRGVRGKGVNSRTLEVFDDFGVVDEIRARALVNIKSRYYQGAEVVHEVDPGAAPANQPTPDRPHPGVALLAQHNTEAVLRERLKAFDVTVELGAALLGYAQDADGVTAEVQHAQGVEQIRARYLVGCDGGRSTVRKLTGIPFIGETWDEEHFLLGSVCVDGLAPDYMHVWSDQAHGVGALILVPLAYDGNWAVHAVAEPDEDGELPTPSLELFQQLFAERAGLPGVRLHDLAWSSMWRPNVRMVEKYRAGRVFLAGDAAHVHSAAGGQGMNTGIQDAYNLGWKLAAVLHGAPEPLLDTYEAERLPVAARVLAVTSAQHKALLRPDEAGEGPTGAEALARQFHQPAGADDFTGLSLDYRDGPLSRDLDRTTGIRAGDRAPDAPCVTADGKPTRLFETFRGPHFTLLAFGERPTPGLPDRDDLRAVTIARPGGAAVADLVDVDGHAYRAYGVDGDAVVLVRPDGYVALTGGAVEAEPIAAYLSAVAAPTG